MVTQLNLWKSQHMPGLVATVVFGCFQGWRSKAQQRAAWAAFDLAQIGGSGTELNQYKVHSAEVIR